MKTKILSIIFLSILLLILLSGSAVAQTSGQDSFNQSALLMLRSKNAMQGQDANELRQLAEYYENYYNNAIANLKASGQDPDDKLAAALQAERDGKVTPLLNQANALDAARQNRPKNNAVRKVARFFSSIIKGGGRALGFGVSKTMDGIGKGAQIVVNEVAPKVIEGVLRHAKTVILSGGTLEGSALRTLVRELFQKHAERALKAHLLPGTARLAERILGEKATNAILVLTGEGEFVQAGMTPQSQPTPTAESSTADSPAQPEPTATSNNANPPAQPAPTTAPSSSENALSPAEAVNQGKHNYVVNGTSSCSPNQTVENGPAFSTHEFTLGSSHPTYVNYTSGNGTPQGFSWVSPNTYEYNIGGGWDYEKITYTLYGYEYYRTGSCEVHFSYTLSD